MYLETLITLVKGQWVRPFLHRCRIVKYVLWNLLSRDNYQNRNVGFLNLFSLNIFFLRQGFRFWSWPWTYYVAKDDYKCHCLKFLFYFYVWMFCLHECTHSSQNRAPNILELELQMFVSHHVAAGNPICVQWEKSPCFYLSLSQC